MIAVVSILCLLISFFIISVLYIKLKKAQHDLSLAELELFKIQIEQQKQKNNEKIKEFFETN